MRKTLLTLLTFAHFSYANSLVLTEEPEYNTSHMIEVEQDLNSEQFNLKNLVRCVLRNNPQIDIAQHRLNASFFRKEEALSQLRPQLNIESSYEQINKDLAGIGFSLYPQRRTNLLAQFSQLIFSLPAYNNLSASKKLQLKETFAYNQDRNELIKQTALSYYNYLKMDAMQKRVASELNLVQELLELAKDRDLAGLGSKKDTFRLESQRSQVQRQYEQSVNLKNQALNQIYKLLGNEKSSIEVDLIESELTSGLNPSMIDQLLSDKDLAATISSLISELSIHHSPLIDSLDTLCCIEKSNLKTTKASFFAPEVHFEGGYDHDLKRWGAGSNQPEGKRRYNWMVGFKASLPILTGGSRIAKVHRIQESIQQLSFQKRQLELNLIQTAANTLSELHRSAKAFLLSQVSAEYSKKTLEFVKDEYQEGIQPLIELTDARNAYLKDTLDEIAARYDYLSTIVQLQSLILSYDFIDSEAFNDLVSSLITMSRYE